MSTREDTNAQIQVKAEQEEMIFSGIHKPIPKRDREPVLDIDYTPENSLKEGLKLVDLIEDRLKCLVVSSAMRKEVWEKEIKSLRGETLPKTLIAVCGATGAGKSSIINAVLDDSIVPTSCTQACTSVVTEISYHDQPNIVGDIHFLSDAEWRNELTVLLRDIGVDTNKDELNDSETPAAIAWQKVRAVYPKIELKDLSTMDVQQIIDLDQCIAQKLGNVSTVDAKTSKKFKRKIARFIESIGPEESSGDGKVALWPLIREVRIRCNAPVLSTGAILVDLPGVADTNAARNTIAKDYMQKANCIWILAPIFRAVNDKTARNLLGNAFRLQLMNGNYDHRFITFVASKTDDLSCAEVIKDLKLFVNPELRDIKARDTALSAELARLLKAKRSSDKVIDRLESELKVRGKHLSALRDGRGDGSKFKIKSQTQKRKSAGKQETPSPKRKRIDEGHSPAPAEDSDSDSVSDSDTDMEATVGEGTEISIDAEVVEAMKSSAKSPYTLCNEAIAALHQKLEDEKKALSQIIIKELALNTHISSLQKEQNAFCSLKRSEYSRVKLKEDFRIGLKEVESAKAEQLDPKSFDPSRASTKNYSSIDLPVFPCSSRDYIRLKGQAKMDGEPTCFTNIGDTGIPQLQQWCHQLTLPARQRTARDFASRLSTFAQSIQSNLQEVGDSILVNRQKLRERWESGGRQLKTRPYHGPTKGGVPPSLLSKSDEETEEIESDEKAGISKRLDKEFSDLVDNCVKDLKLCFKDGLEEKCRVGAQAAADMAVDTAKNIGEKLRWNTYRAILTRYGHYGFYDINTELLRPFVESIASSWTTVFKSDFSRPFQKGIEKVITLLLDEFKDTVSADLKNRAKDQGLVCFLTARSTIRKATDSVARAMDKHQKALSRSMVPHVQNALQKGYENAMLEKGPGSAARQRESFCKFVEDNKNEIFLEGAEAIIRSLDEATDAVRKALSSSLEGLSKKIEVNLAVLWEAGPQNPAQTLARKSMIETVVEIQAQLAQWSEAGKQVHVNDDVKMDAA